MRNEIVIHPDIQAEIESNQDNALVMGIYHAPWCKDCDNFMVRLREAVSEFGEEINVVMINVGPKVQEEKPKFNPPIGMDDVSVPEAHLHYGPLPGNRMIFVPESDDWTVQKILDCLNDAKDHRTELASPAAGNNSIDEGPKMS